MAANKTQPTDASVEQFLAAIGPESRRADCTALVALMTKAAKSPARMWGSGIVGFGVHRYKYESGREGETCAVGFASRKDAISIYGLHGAGEESGLLAKLGKYKAGKGCLHVARMDDIDAKVLEKMVAVATKARANG